MRKDTSKEVPFLVPTIALGRILNGRRNGKPIII
nr:MAG TPA: hypothetical protein [Caudoviricetes sp.]